MRLTINRPRKGVIIACAVIAAALALIVTLIMTRLTEGTQLRMTSTGLNLKFDFDSGSSFAAPNTGFYYCTKDGISYVLSDGTRKMDYVHTFTSPSLLLGGVFAGVYDAGGKALNVYDQAGLKYSLSFEDPIHTASVNPLGYSSVIAEASGGGYDVYVYNDGGVRMKQSHFKDSNVFPVSAELSDDGRILAVSLLDFSGIEVNSKLVFYLNNKSEADVLTSDIFASSADNPGEYITLTRFLEGNRLLTVSDKSISLLDVEQGCNELWSVELGNELDALCLLDGQGFAAASGNPLINAASPDQIGLVKVYDMEGTVTGEYQCAERVSFMSGAYNTLLVGTGGSISAVSMDGRELWSHQTLSETAQALFVDNNQTLLLSSAGDAELLRLRRVSEILGADTDDNSEGEQVEF